MSVEDVAFGDEEKGAKNASIEGQGWWAEVMTFV